MYTLIHSSCDVLVKFILQWIVLYLQVFFVFFVSFILPERVIIVDICV